MALSVVPVTVPPAEILPSTDKAAVPVAELVMVNVLVLAEALLRSIVNAVPDFWMVVVLEPKITVPPAASRVRLAEAPEASETAPLPVKLGLCTEVPK